MQDDRGTAALIEATAEIARHLIRGGASPTEALSLVGPALLASQYGEEGLLLLGVGERTARQRTARIKELVTAANAAEDLLDAEEDLGVRA
ncbi:hypothetical protein CLV92_10850 [Kineococcus xinjiangensis]|uniref:Uncharacterized protein n=1 Tax=Kineococcus xinjiangensis TaxID=512762 RepID=A0A2S6IIV8_9ACTN|nr:hypothetical protein [Kineococcus xinjiangensis]PPK94152.1 hypothetical protein CLV92_10850 [Kineococcus xinjiangensis]